ncbi:MAG: hypothetical protein ACI90V_008278 [Bacillariaceae sp.]|jgi:hypothetical protein
MGKSSRGDSVVARLGDFVISLICDFFQIAEFNRRIATTTATGKWQTTKQIHRLLGPTRR